MWKFLRCAVLYKLSVEPYSIPYMCVGESPNRFHFYLSQRVAPSSSWSRSSDTLNRPEWAAGGGATGGKCVSWRLDHGVGTRAELFLRSLLQIVLVRKRPPDPNYFAVSGSQDFWFLQKWSSKIKNTGTVYRYLVIPKSWL